MELNLLDTTICLRAARADDSAFLSQVYASTRADEMALVPWTEAQKAAFLRFQFEAQSSHYQTYYRASQTWVILRAGHPAGRMIVDEVPSEVLLMDIALLPECRGAGIGTALLRALQAYAARTSRPIRLHVEYFNPALRLYERLGFVKTGEQGINYEMTWHPKSA